MGPPAHKLGMMINLQIEYKLNRTKIDRYPGSENMAFPDNLLI